MPEVIRKADFAKLSLLQSHLELLAVGCGVLGVSVVTARFGRSAAPQVFGGQALLLGLGSLLTYGYAIIYIGA